MKLTKSHINLALLITLFPLTTPGLAEETAKRYTVDTAASSIKWHGAKVGTDHFGKVRLKSGWLTLVADHITGGEFVADMTSISNDDLTSQSQNKKLIGHLMSDDFFAVKKFPESKFVITKATAKGGGNQELTGQMTIRGISQPLNFTATIKIADGQLTGKGKLTFNRAKHDVKFHSGTVAKLGDKLIYDDVPLDVELVAKAR